MDTASYLSVFNNLDGARIEGRLETVTQRQKEIQKLYKAVQANEKELVLALSNDLGWTHVDGLVEIATVLQAIRILFESHDIKTAVANEHLISTTKKNLVRRAPLGNILILAEPAAPISQSIIPLCLAVAEGNPTVLVLSPRAPQTSAKLLGIINESTDRDAIVALKPETASELRNILTTYETLAWHGIVIQSHLTRSEIEILKFQQSSPSIQIIFQAPSSSSIIVTRNADIRKAANDVAVAKFSFFAGRSVVAPGAVLVDEFVLDEFLGVLESCIRSFIAARPPKTKALRHLLQETTNQAVEHFVNGAAGKGARVVQISPTNSMETLLIGSQGWSTDNFRNLRTDGTDQVLGYIDPVLAIQPTTSMEAALKISNELNKDASSTVYIFSNPSEARYLSLFTTSASKYLNHIPLETSISPYPPSFIESLSPGFSQMHLIRPSGFTSAYSATEQLQRAITSGKGKIVGLKDIIARDLAPPKQKPGFQVGFFPQGGRVGLSHVILLLGLSVTGLVWGVRRSLRV